MPTPDSKHEMINALDTLSKSVFDSQKEYIREIVKEEIQKLNVQLTQPEEEKVYSVGEASIKSKISESTIWRIIKSGELKSFRLGKKLIRIKESDLKALMIARNIRGIK